MPKFTTGKLNKTETQMRQYGDNIMTFNKTSFRGYEVNVIFTGSHYYFHSTYAGVIAIAERMPYQFQEAQTFKVKAGNRHLVGGSLGSASVILANCKKFINKAENQFIKVSVDYELEEMDGADLFLEMGVKSYR